MATRDPQEVTNSLSHDLRIRDFEAISLSISPAKTPRPAVVDISGAIEARLNAITLQISATLACSKAEVSRCVERFSRWMIEGTIVRVIGAGRARLAAAIPANRLAHGGARVFVQDDIIPMPHSINGGAILAASASGKTPSVLSVLRAAREKTRDIEIVGIADCSALEFRSYCDLFIGIQPIPEGVVSPLRALADTEEYVISELLDAIVVAGGELAGFVDVRWRLGHEDLGSTGPYDVSSRGWSR